MTIKQNYIAYFLGCVVDGMSSMFHISKFCTQCNDKHMPMFFFFNIQALAIGEYKQYLLCHTLGHKKKIIVSGHLKILN